MRVGAQLSVPDKRRTPRHPVVYLVPAEHRLLGSIQLHVINISSQGLMCKGQLGIECGERITIHLPVLGHIDAHLIWSKDGKNGFQFERIIPREDFSAVMDILQPNPRLRPKR